MLSLLLPTILLPILPPPPAAKQLVQGWPLALRARWAWARWARSICTGGSYITVGRIINANNFSSHITITIKNSEPTIAGTTTLEVVVTT